MTSNQERRRNPLAKAANENDLDDPAGFHFRVVPTSRFKAAKGLGDCPLKNLIGQIVQDLKSFLRRERLRQRQTAAAFTALSGHISNHHSESIVELRQIPLRASRSIAQLRNC